MEDPTNKPKTVICIGDIHGHCTKLHNLWSNLQSQIDPQSFNTATVIFLGDYCDRGPHTRQVLDFLTSLPKQHPHQKHVFLAGNHDFGFAGFIVALPGEFEAKDTWREHAENEENEGWFKGEGYEKMHLQGRIWGGLMKAKFDDKGVEFKGSGYDAAPAFESYGLSHGSADLVKVVPEEHKKFLADMVWVHEEDDVCIETEGGLKHYKLIAVHAGLEREKNVQEQLEFLRARDCRLPKIKPLSGRKDVWDIPEELTDTIVVSGHHGKLHIEGRRLIVDEGGGLESNPMAAIVLPSMKIIRDTDRSS